MAHFAELDEDNIVKQVIVVHNNELLDENGNESEQKGIDFCIAHYGGTWIQTSYNRSFRGIYAAIGMSYNKEKDSFIELPAEKVYFTMGASEFFDRNMTEFIGKPNLKFLEIGSYIGTSAVEQVKNVLTGENSTIICVDSWENSFNPAETLFDKNTLPYADKITKAKSDSKIWLENNQGQVFDFIYIDGDHSAQSIESDTRLSWPLLKVGGVMALDDVLLNDETEQANNAFIESVKDKSTIIENGYQVWLRKTTA